VGTAPATPVEAALLKYREGTSTSVAHGTAFTLGFQARQTRKPRESVPYQEKGYRGAWLDGWDAANERKGA
jgi:ribosome modulation factor